jgi:hypothetical protein
VYLNPLTLKKLTNFLVFLLLAGSQVAFAQKTITDTITKANEGNHVSGLNDSLARMRNDVVFTALGIKRECGTLGYTITTVHADDM